jgi:hypothetical protein
MIRDRQALEEFERALSRSTKPDLTKNLRIVNAMYEEARHLGVFPPKHPMDGIETVIKIARVVNLVRGDSLEDSSRTG